jgi:hypothetical protein
MAWRIFGGLVGISAYVAVALGVSAANAPALVQFVGYVGAVFIAVAVASWVMKLQAVRTHPAPSPKQGDVVT